MIIIIIYFLWHFINHHHCQPQHCLDDSYQIEKQYSFSLITLNRSKKSTATSTGNSGQHFEKNNPKLNSYLFCFQLYISTKDSSGNVTRIWLWMFDTTTIWQEPIRVGKYVRQKWSQTNDGPSIKRPLDGLQIFSLIFTMISSHLYVSQGCDELI